MATLPYFVFSPSTILSTIGILRGPDPTVPTPAEDWRTAKVDVVIPCLNEEAHIVLCLESVLRQTLKPRRIILVDDGSTDRTVELAQAFCEFHGVELTAIRRRKPIGKTPTIKRQARELDSDVEFILDADTVLESDNYIERLVTELYQAVGIGSACGTILPMRKRDLRRFLEAPKAQAFHDAMPSARPAVSRGWLRDLARGVTNLYREVLYLFLQRFVYKGQVVFFGTTSNPVGCAVAYRRKYVEQLFDHFGPIFGDDLTNSEDIFLGFAMLNEGYRNLQITDVSARTVEPEVQRLPKQIYLWSSAFFQSCYYFDPLLKSPFKAMKRFIARRREEQPLKPRYAEATGGRRLAFAAQGTGASTASSQGIFRATAVELEPARTGSAGTPAKSGRERRVIQEPYRQAFGRDRTLRDGRPAGWMLMMGAVEKVFFPATLLIMMILGNWHGLWLTMAVETLIGMAVLAFIMKGHRLEYLFKGLLATPVRYAVMTSELVTIGRFAADVWVTKNRNWRK